MEHDFPEAMHQVNWFWTLCCLFFFIIVAVVYHKVVSSSNREPHEKSPKGPISYSLGDLSEMDLQTEKPVDVTFVLLKWNLSRIVQVGLVVCLVISTFVYQVWLWYTNQRHGTFDPEAHHHHHHHHDSDEEHHHHHHHYRPLCFGIFDFQICMYFHNPLHEHKPESQGPPTSYSAFQEALGFLE